MPYYFPFGETVKRLVQEDRTPKKVFVLGVYASAVHAKWTKGSKLVCNALAVASEPRIFWDGNPEEATKIIGKIKIPKELGTLSLPDKDFNGPSAKVLDEHILAPLSFTRKDAWLCDLYPETLLNRSQVSALERSYEKERERYGLNEVTIPKRRSSFCNSERCKEIVAELEESQSELLILLGDIPIKQFLNKVAVVEYKSLKDYVDLYGYGEITKVTINGRSINIQPLAHPRQIGALGGHNKDWFYKHKAWESKQRA